MSSARISTTSPTSLASDRRTKCVPGAAQHPASAELGRANRPPAGAVDICGTTPQSRPNDGLNVHVQAYPDRQSRRDRLPHHQDGATPRDRDRRGLFGSRPGRAARRDGRPGGADRDARRRRELSRDRQDHRRRHLHGRRGRASGLRLPIRACGVRRSPDAGRDCLHRPQSAGDRCHGRQDRR